MKTKIEIPRDEYDRLLFWIASIGAMMLWVMSIYYFPDLPDRVPSHFNGRGEVDAYASKYILLLLPAVASGVWFLLEFFSNKPHLYNYPVKITEENRERQFKLANKMIRILNASLIVMFLYIQWTMIQGAITGHSKISIFFQLLMTGWIMFVSFGYLYYAWKIK